MTTYKLNPGSHEPLGVSATAQGHNFSLYSEHAQEVALALFAPKEKFPFLEVPMVRHENCWCIKIEGLPSTFEYAYLINGAYLLDPYAKKINTSHVWAHSLEQEPGGYHPKGVVSPDPSFSWEGVLPPRIPLEELIIYEMHVRAFTKSPSSKVKYPGTFEGVIEKIPYFKEMGINAIELMPVCEFNETAYKMKDPIKGGFLYNFWGYSTVNFFTPCNRFAASETLTAFKKMVKMLHREGIEVILDMVYNHTGEGGSSVPPASFRGIDVLVYYMHNKEGNEIDFTGTGNSVNCNHPAVAKLIVDSLRYWVAEMHVDGFRFDLASIFFRDSDGTPMEDPPVLKAIREDPILSQVKLIAEPWDAGGLYQVGEFPKWGPFSEWNGKYRDIVRRFIKGSDGVAGAFATALCGSQDLYGRYDGPQRSINFITAHDGFSLYDLVSYQDKHNERNGEENRDGMNENDSWNCGSEGPTKNRKILLLRQRQVRNFLLALFVSQGVPMLSMGDEYLHTKHGNNNTWCQDNELNWFNWKNAHPAFTRFVRLLIQFRHRSKFFKRTEFLSTDDVAWHGHEPNKPDWSNGSRFVAYTLKHRGKFCYIAFNAHYYDAAIHLPAVPHQKWYLAVDTSLPPPDDFIEHPFDESPLKTTYILPPNSALLLLSHE